MLRIDARTTLICLMEVKKVIKSLKDGRSRRFSTQYLTEYSAVTTLVQIPTGYIRCTNHKLEHINDVL
jgi:hypothetical protein